MSSFEVSRSDRSGLESVVIRSADGQHSTEILLFGGTLVSWVCDGKERIFLSPDALYNGKKAIRGGIPLVFPQFGQPKDSEGHLALPALSQHGFARNSMWTKHKSNTTSTSGTATFVLTDSDTTLAVWPHPFRLEFAVTLTDGQLLTDFRISNTGDAPFKFQSLLHTYLKVNEVTNIKVDGFKGCNCKNQLTGEIAPEPAAVNTIDREVDNIYLQAQSLSGEFDIGDLTLIEEGQRALVSSAQASFLRTGVEIPVDVVFWNPWIEKSKGLADLPDEAYHNFLCIEPGVVQDWITLEAGDGVSLLQTLKLLP